MNKKCVYAGLGDESYHDARIRLRIGTIRYAEANPPPPFKKEYPRFTCKATLAMHPARLSLAKSQITRTLDCAWTWDVCFSPQRYANITSKPVRVDVGNYTIL